MKFLIPSYKRANNITTVNTLHQLGIDSKDIFVGVQGDEELKDYQKAELNCNLVKSDAHNAAGNRQALIDKVLKKDERAILMDDDIDDILTVYLNENNYGRTHSMKEADNSSELFSKMIEHGYSVAKNNIWGIKHSLNPWALTNGLVEIKEENAPDYSTNVLIEGSFMAFTNNGLLRFDNTIPFSEDYEAVLNCITNGGIPYKLLTYASKKVKSNGQAKGGCNDLYKKGKLWIHKITQEKIVDKYPDLVRFSRKKPDCISLTIRWQNLKKTNLNKKNNYN